MLGTVSTEIRFNLTKGYVVREKSSMYFKGHGRNLKTDETDLLVINGESSVKNKYKKK